jgi:hypothetical protein
MLRQAGLPTITRPHDLRHAHATHVMAQRADLRTISDRLGHASAGFTLDVYGQALRGRRRQAAESLPPASLEGSGRQLPADAVRDSDRRAPRRFYAHKRAYCCVKICAMRR